MKIFKKMNMQLWVLFEDFNGNIIHFLFFLPRFQGWFKKTHDWHKTIHKRAYFHYFFKMFHWMAFFIQACQNVRDLYNLTLKSSSLRLPKAFEVSNCLYLYEDTRNTISSTVEPTGIFLGHQGPAGAGLLSKVFPTIYETL